MTSQLFANVYMDPLDQFVKHRFKPPGYVRYADYFVMLSEDRRFLEALLPRVKAFLRDTLRLEMHPDKVSIKTFAGGVDFLGWVNFLDHRVMRSATRRRMLKKLAELPTRETIASYRGMLGHGNARRLEREVEYPDA